MSAPKTIDELSSNATLDGTEEVPVWQAGTTKKSLLSTLAAYVNQIALSFIQSGTGATAETVQQTLRRVIYPQQFGAVGDGVTNDMPAFRLAIQTNGANAIVRVPAATYLFSFASSTKTDDIISVPSNCEIVFDKGAKIQFSYNGLPLFCFANVSHSSIRGARFEFTGTLPTSADYTRAQVGTATGFTPAIGDWGGDYEVCSIILSVGSSYCEFSDIEAKSNTVNATNLFGYLVNIKGDQTGPSVTLGNKITDIYARHHIQTILVTGQQDMEVARIKTDYRGGTATFFAPGHVLYTSGVTTNPNTGIYIHDIWDGPNVVNWPTSMGYCMAPLAPKNVTNSTWDNITSFHPEGLIQSMADCTKSSFSRLFWQNSDTQAWTGTDPINIVDGSNTPSNDQVAFRNVSLIARNNFRGIKNTGTATTQTNFSFDDIYIETDFNFYSGQVSGLGAFDWRGNNATFKNIVCKPSATLSGSMNTVLQCRACNNIYFDGALVGQYVSPNVARAPSGTASGNFIRIATESAMAAEDYAHADAFLATATYTSESLSGMEHLRSYNVVSANTDRSMSITLPSRGSYLVFSDVVESGRDHGQSAVFLVTFTGQTATINDQQQLGSTITRGTHISALGIAITTAGVLTVSWTSATNNFCSVNIGYTKIGSFVT